MMPALRRAAALAILLLLPVAAWILVADPVIGLARDRIDDIAALAQRRADLDLILSRRPDLRREEAALRVRLAEEGGFWAGASAPAIAAAVQDRLRQVVTAHGGLLKTAAEIRSAATLGAELGADRGTADRSADPGAGPARAAAIRTRFRIEGTLETIRATLAAIETSRPALFVDGLTITGQDGDGTVEKPPMLALDLDVTAFRAPVRP